MAQQLTDALCRAVKAPGSGRTEIADVRCIGLSFRVTAAGARSWSFRFRDPDTGKTMRATIGPYPAVSLADARAKAEVHRKEVAAGINPVEQRRRHRSTALTRTFGALAARYLLEHADRHKRPRSADMDRRNLNNHVLPKWRDWPFARITRADVIELLEGMIVSGRTTACNRVHALISKIFSFAIDADLLAANPCTRLKKRGVERVGRRVLSDGEIRLFWHSVILPPASPVTGYALRLALLTGCRASEAAEAARSEFHRIHERHGSTWLLPAARVKNKRAHMLPLPDFTAETVQAALDLAGESLFLFPSPREGGAQPITGHALGVAMSRLTKHFVDLDDPAARTWCADPPTPHDLRRTFETRLSEIGIPKEDRDATLNHARNDIGAKHYDLYDRAKEKFTALDCWAAAVAAIIGSPQSIVIGNPRLVHLLNASGGRSRHHSALRAKRLCGGP